MNGSEPTPLERRPLRAASRAVADQALSAYDLQPTTVRLISDEWNTTYRVTGDDGEQYLLRLHRPAVTSTEPVRVELDWLTALARDTALLVPRVLLRRDARPAAIVSAAGIQRVCVVFRWIDGRFLEAGLRPVHLRRVGRLAAQLHDHSATYRPPRRPRRLYGVDDLTWNVEDPLAPESVDRLSRTMDEVYEAGSGSVVQDFLARVRNVRDALGESPDEYGLVHGDLHQENVLFTDGQAAAIDFDDCGLGHHAYDLAVLVSELAFRSDVADLQVALLAGYREIRSFSAAAEAAMPTFAELKRTQIMFWNLDRREGATAQKWRGWVGADLAALAAFLRS